MDSRTSCRGILSSGSSHDSRGRGTGTGRGSGSGRGAERGRGRSAFAAGDTGRSMNQSWRAPAASTVSGSVEQDFGGAPSDFGTPAFVGGPSSSNLDPFGDPIEAVPLKATPSNQISTLEVLGEDSESRRKRFESTLSHNRYQEVRLLSLPATIAMADPNPPDQTATRSTTDS